MTDIRADTPTVRHRPKPITPDTYERVLAIGAAMLLAAVLAALARGQAEWHRVPPIVWAHLATIVVALVLTPVMLLRPRGTASHRTLGRVWATAMALTAALSFGIGQQFSVIHVLSFWTLIQVPLIIRSARRHDVRRHRFAVRAMVTGALLIAGAFTFPFGRLLGHWLFA